MCSIYSFICLFICSYEAETVLILFSYFLHISLETVGKYLTLCANALLYWKWCFKSLNLANWCIMLYSWKFLFILSCCRYVLWFRQLFYNTCGWDNFPVNYSISCPQLMFYLLHFWPAVSNTILTMNVVIVRLMRC